MDVSDVAVQHMTPYDSSAGTAVVPFDPVSPERFPEVAHDEGLVAHCHRRPYRLLLGGGGSGGAGRGRAASPPPAAGPKQAPKAKRVTTVSSAKGPADPGKPCLSPATYFGPPPLLQRNGPPRPPSGSLRSTQVPSCWPVAQTGFRRTHLFSGCRIA